MENIFYVETPSKRKIKIEVYADFISKENLDIRKQCFAELCRNCRNYGKKYSCPPKSPDFGVICNREGIFIVMFKCNLGQIENTSEYNKIRIANSIMKSRIDRLMRELEARVEERTGTKLKFLSSGSCRLCKKCNLEKNLACKHPKEMRFSLEATGIHVEALTKKLFSTPLLWYDAKNSKAPDYTRVIAGLMCDRKDIEAINYALNNHFSMQ